MAAEAEAEVSPQDASVEERLGVAGSNTQPSAPSEDNKFQKAIAAWRSW